MERQFQCLLWLLVGSWFFQCLCYSGSPFPCILVGKCQNRSAHKKGVWGFGTCGKVDSFRDAAFLVLQLQNVRGSEQVPANRVQTTLCWQPTSSCLKRNYIMVPYQKFNFSESDSGHIENKWPNAQWCFQTNRQRTIWWSTCVFFDAALPLYGFVTWWLVIIELQILWF